MDKKGLIYDSDKLSKVTGGADTANGSYQLYYNGIALPMSATVAQMCSQYPEIKEKLGLFYLLVSGKTLNELCESYGQEKIQGLINANS